MCGKDIIALAVLNIFILTQIAGLSDIAGIVFLKLFSPGLLIQRAMVFKGRACLGTDRSYRCVEYQLCYVCGAHGEHVASSSIFSDPWSNCPCCSP